MTTAATNGAAPRTGAGVLTAVRAPSWTILTADEASAKLLGNCGKTAVHAGNRAALERIAPGAEVLLVGDAAKPGLVGYLRGRGIVTWWASLPFGAEDVETYLHGRAAAAGDFGLGADVLRELWDVVEDSATVIGEEQQRETRDAPRGIEPLRLLTLSDLAAMPPRDWLVRGLLARGDLAVLAGSPGTFKSFLALDLALAVADAREWLGRTVGAGRSLDVAGEGIGGILARVRASVGAARVADPQDPLHARFSVAASMPDISSPLGQAATLAAVDALPEPPSVIVVDTLARALAVGGNDEDKTRDMGAFIAGCDLLRAKTGAAILVVHHNGKAPGAGERGNSALRGASDVMLKVERDDASLTVRVSCTKAKDAEQAPPVVCELARVVVGEESDGTPVTSLRVATTRPAGAADNPPGSKATKPPTRDTLRAALREAGDSGLGFTQAKAAASRAGSTTSDNLAAMVRDGEALPFMDSQGRQRWRWAGGDS